MLTAAAVCPHPPLLIPEATGSPGAAGAELRLLRTACRQAVAALLAERPDLIAVVGADPKAVRTAEYPPRALGRLHDYGIPFTVGDQGEPALPLSLTVGKWLLANHPAPPAAWWGIASDAPPAECLRLGEKLALLAPPGRAAHHGRRARPPGPRRPARRRPRSRPLRRPAGRRAGRR